MHFGIRAKDPGQSKPHSTWGGSWELQIHHFDKQANLFWPLENVKFQVRTRLKLKPLDVEFKKSLEFFNTE